METPAGGATPGDVGPAAGVAGPWLPFAWRYGTLGVLLGAGAPAGALLLRALSGVPDPAAELSDNAFFYLYQLLGSCTVFGLAGVFVGRRADRLRSGRELYRELSEHDSLTGLANARAFLDHYARAIERSRRFDQPISLLVIDVDRLKTLNDTLGHSFGNAALVHVARALASSKRADDMAARWGGDEFALLMPGADQAAASRQADAILEGLRREPLAYEGANRPITVTIGIASATGPSKESLFESADRALFEGKRAGRGRAGIAT